jgi:hypothetical protein
LDALLDAATLLRLATEACARCGDRCGDRTGVDW